MSQHAPNVIAAHGSGAVVARGVRCHAGQADRDQPTSCLPSQVMAFGTLYGQYCAGCHGADGRLGAARPLNDPVYLALVPPRPAADDHRPRRAGHRHARVRAAPADR